MDEDNNRYQLELMRKIRLALRNDQTDLATASLIALIEVAQQNGDVGAEGRHRGNLALIYHRRGQTDEALEQLEAALACARHEGDRLTENGLLGNIGNILREIGAYDPAITYLEQALLIAAELNDQRGRGIWLSNMGLLYDDLNDHRTAITYHKEAVSIARNLSDQRGLATRLRNLATSIASTKDFKTALHYLKEANDLFQMVGTTDEQLQTAITNGDFHVEAMTQTTSARAIRRHMQGAFESYQTALGLAAETPQAAAETLQKIGALFAAVGENERALKAYQEAQERFLTLNMLDAAERVHAKMHDLDKKT